jgi:predicted RNA-binding protein with PIN domain
LYSLRQSNLNLTQACPEPVEGFDSRSPVLCDKTCGTMHPYGSLAYMPYLIDGHNLIPKLGLRLDSIDDEAELISRLQEFCRLRRAQVEVFFDGAPPGQAAIRKAGVVTAHFVHQGSSADAAIEIRLKQLGKTARNWTVVSSDGRVQQAARAVHASVLSSEEFAGEMSRVQAMGATMVKHAATLAPDEVEEWLDIFGQRKE